MLELMGSGYVIEHCVSAFLHKQQQEMYQNYVADALYYISQQTGVKLSKHLHEMQHPVQDDTDSKPVEQVADERMQRLGISVVK